ncbi:MAG: DUF2791 family P-loop domain-containing protein [Verrucomicrobia bacterium]|nr:DUF2791 family P-loop domain-containing protein [Verrucomicrobiota bacterium]
MTSDKIAIQVIEALRRGVPPQRGTQLYAVGHEKLMEGIKRFHLTGIEDKGIIRFISGSWGAGKTHFFRLMRELAFDHGCLVSNVELNVNEAPLNRFERVFYGILRNIITPTFFREYGQPQAAPFGIVLQEALTFLATGQHALTETATHENYTKAAEKLMACEALDIDFRKIVKKYWETFLPENPDPVIIKQTRDEILQWFSGEGTLGNYRKNYGINKMVSKDNAKVMMQSLSAFVKLAGYQGLVILFDEAEMSYSVMRKSALRDAHNNLLHLINNVEALTGLFLIYATTPDFYTDPKHGIVISGMLQTRIGKPEDRPPRALDVVWNLDAIEFNLAQYQEVGRKIRAIYASAYPGSEAQLPNVPDTELFVKQLFEGHPSLSQVRFWRVLTSGCVRHFDDAMEGEVKPASQTYKDVMEILRES